jgi:hypothetical protein
MTDRKTVIVYEGHDLLMKDHLIKIYNLEQRIKSMAEWKNVCLAQSITDSTCHNAISFMSPLGFLTQQGNNVDLMTAT